MIWHKFKQEFLNELQYLYSKEENESLFYLLMEHYTGIYRPNSSQLQQPISKDVQQEVQEIINRLKKDEPLQYILGYAYFDDLQLKVSPDVLIPRQETEELIYWIKEHLKRKNFTAIDLGTGSGAIAIALAKHFTNALITAVDISEIALTIAKENARTHKAEITFLQDDILDLDKRNSYKKYDLIVSNPPYILPSFRKQMNDNVTQHEPALALFAPENDVLIFYKKILEFAQSHLKIDGFLFFEINEFYKNELVNLANQKNFSAIVKKDLNDNWRMMKCQLKT